MADGAAPVRQEPRDKKAKPSAKDGKGTAAPWMEKVDTALAREEKPWRIQARKVVQRYRDERTKGDLTDLTRINILWANTEILRSAMLPRIPKPDVRRRFPDGKSGNSASRIAAEVIERAVTFVVDTEDTEAVLTAAVDDLLLPGRGVVWVTYDPTIEEPEEDTEDALKGTQDELGADDDQPIDAAPPASSLGEATSGEEPGKPSPGSPHVKPTSTGGRIIAQRVRFEYVFWEDYTEGQARTDKLVPWKARRHAVAKEEFERKFPKAQKQKLKSTATYKLTDASDRQGMFADTEYIECWEIWARGPRQRIWIARGYADVLEPENEDPYELAEFYPTPRPLRSVVTTDRQVPVPEFLQYEDQCAELDRVTTRLHSLTEQMKFHGVFDSSIPDGQAPGSSILASVTSQPDGVFIGHPNFQMIAARGGLDAVFQALPLDMLVKVIDILTKRRQQLIEEIYQVTGISDIVRGSTDPNETKGAQTLKAQFGSVRMSARQSELQRFIRDLFRIAGELIAEHYTVDTLREITGFDLPTNAEKVRLQAQVDAMGQGAMLPAPPEAGPSPMVGPGAEVGALPTPESPSNAGGAPSTFAMGGAPEMGGAPPPMGGMPASLPPTGGAPPPLGPSGAGAPPTPPAMGGEDMAGGPPMPGMEMGGPPGAEQASMQAPSGAPPAEQPEPEIPSEIKSRLALPTWEEIMAILRSDRMRGYRVDIESDATAVEDADAEKQRRIEAIAGIRELLAGAVQISSVSPKLMPLARELTMFGLRTFKPARSLEQAVEDAFDELQNNPPPPPPDPKAAAGGPDPANMGRALAAKAEVERKAMRDAEDVRIEKIKTTSEVELAKAEAAKIRAETQQIVADAQAAIQALQSGGEQRVQDAEIAREDARAQSDVAVNQEKVRASQSKTQVDAQAKQQDQALKERTVQGDQAIKQSAAQDDRQIKVHNAEADRNLRAREGQQKHQLNQAEGQARIKTAFMKASRPPSSPSNGAGLGA